METQWAHSKDAFSVLTFPAAIAVRQLGGRLLVAALVIVAVFELRIFFVVFVHPAAIFISLLVVEVSHCILVYAL